MRQEFFIDAEPKAQGRPRSKRVGKRTVFDRRRQQFVTRDRTITYDPQKSRIFKRLVAWTVAAAQPVMMEGPLSLIVEFLMPRPKSHYGKHGLKASAPYYHTSKPDWDNLVKAVKDALNKLVWKDDSTVAVALVIKRYADKPGIKIIVQEAT